MKIDRGDVVGFVLGIVTSIVANIIWEKYKENKKELDYGEKAIISEMQSAIDGLSEELKQHINKKI